MSPILKPALLLSLINPLITPLVTSSPLAAKADCDRAALTAAANAYIAAQTAGSLTPLQDFLAPNWTYTENNKDIPHTSGVLHKPLKIEHTRTTTDPVLCASYTELIAPSGPYVLGTQLRLAPASLKITLIDTIASTTGSWLFNATKTLSYVQQEKWDKIPAARWDTREAIQAAGDAYMDMWSDAGAADKVPWGTPCTRLEGSAYTGKGEPGDSCKPGIPSRHDQLPNSRRRYVVDQESGSVSILCVWEHMMNAADSHEFRLENGKLRYVHTMTSCGDKVCRL
ncbi:hypothetical protein CC80DRAFT_431038 [Byssothecium circinans]|uniref:DUF8021 domain-containing protein n=1 Tax=Byssothecium circinans TaxID=147558 RepID=A0A6A5T6V6_9PLEO|nr:hypothetical protein CC80DRAFT_431038 [Byssothecium circinans]